MNAGSTPSEVNLATAIAVIIEPIAELGRRRAGTATVLTRDGTLAATAGIATDLFNAGIHDLTAVAEIFVRVKEAFIALQDRALAIKTRSIRVRDDTGSSARSAVGNIGR